MKRLVILFLLTLPTLGQNTPLHRRPEVIKAMRVIWSQTENGNAKREAAFIVENSGRVVMFPSDDTVASNHIKINTDTLAVFHVHPSTIAPTPSEHDMAVANTYGILMYAVHLKGLYEYDPATKKTTQVERDLDWSKQ